MRKWYLPTPPHPVKNFTLPSKKVCGRSCVVVVHFVAISVVVVFITSCCCWPFLGFRWCCKCDFFGFITLFNCVSVDVKISPIITSLSLFLSLSLSLSLFHPLSLSTLYQFFPLSQKTNLFLIPAIFKKSDIARSPSEDLRFSYFFRKWQKQKHSFKGAIKKDLSELRKCRLKKANSHTNPFSEGVTKGLLFPRLTMRFKTSLVTHQTICFLVLISVSNHDSSRLKTRLKVSLVINRTQN